MAEMKTQIPLQEKIAELERRIEALEKGRTVTRTMTESTFTITGDSRLSEHWNKMWDEFHETMKSIFK